MDQTVARRGSSSADYAGICISALCMIHCLALPVLIAVMPVLGAVFEGQEWIHQLLVAFAFIAVNFAFFRGISAHGRFEPFLIASIGLVLLVTALVVGEEHWAEKLLTVVGALVTAGGHFWNFNLTKQARAD